MPRFRVFDHTADLGVFFYGRSPQEVFVNAGLALMSLLGDTQSKRDQRSMELLVEGIDLDDLLVSWLRELLYLFQDQQLVVIGITVDEFSEIKIRAALTLCLVETAKFGARHDIKAVTYHQAELKPIRNGWRGRIVFDL